MVDPADRKGLSRWFDLFKSSDTKAKRKKESADDAAVRAMETQQKDAEAPKHPIRASSGGKLSRAKEAVGKFVSEKILRKKEEPKEVAEAKQKLTQEKQKLSNLLHNYAEVKRSTASLKNREPPEGSKLSDHERNVLSWEAELQKYPIWIASQKAEVETAEEALKVAERGPEIEKKVKKREGPLIEKREALCEKAGLFNEKIIYHPRPAERMDVENAKTSLEEKLKAFRESDENMIIAYANLTDVQAKQAFNFGLPDSEDEIAEAQRQYVKAQMQRNKVLSSFTREDLKQLQQNNRTAEDLLTQLNSKSAELERTKLWSEYAKKDLKACQRDLKKAGFAKIEPESPQYENLNPAKKEEFNRLYGAFQKTARKVAELEQSLSRHEGEKKSVQDAFEKLVGKSLVEPNPFDFI